MFQMNTFNTKRNGNRHRRDAVRVIKGRKPMQLFALAKFLKKGD
jgi:hypothetical protein